MDPEIQQLIAQINSLRQELFSHDHDGNFYRSVYTSKLFGEISARVGANPATIATTGNTDIYIIAPITGNLISADFSGVDVLATSDTNYITFTITNLGQAGAGTTVMLAATAPNTTKATGGTAIAANTKFALTINSTPNNTQVVEGDRLLIRAAATGTLANTVTFPTYILRFI